MFSSADIAAARTSGDGSATHEARSASASGRRSRRSASRLAARAATSPVASDPRQDSARSGSRPSPVSLLSLRIATAAAARTAGASSSSAAARARRASTSGDRASRTAAISRVPASGACKAAMSAARTSGAASRSPSPGPPSRICSPRPLRSVRSSASAYRRRIAIDDRHACRRRHQAEPEDLLRGEKARGQQQQDADQHGPDLPGDAVHERDRLGSMGRRQDVVERAPGRVRDAALGDLLDDRERRGGRERERDDPQPEPAEVDEGKEQGRRCDAESPVETVRQPERDHERDPGDGRRDDPQDPRQLGLVRVGGPSGPEVGERDREHQDRQQDVGRRDESKERRASDLVEADAHIGRDRPPSGALRDPARSDVALREDGDHGGRRPRTGGLRDR